MKFIMSIQKKTRYYHKGERIFCLLTSHTQPNVFIPVSAVVQEMKWDEINPIYQVKVTRFFDNISYLKKHLKRMRFSQNFGIKPFVWRLDDEDLKTVAGLTKKIREGENKYYVAVDSVLCTKYEQDMRDLFAKLLFFLIGRDLQNIKENSTRSFYKGGFRFDSILEFKTRFEKFFSDKFSEQELKRFLDTL